MKTKQIYSVIEKLLFTGLLMASISAQAIPVLQVGAPAGAGDSGTYADYQASTSDPTEDDTAITGSTTLYFAGIYKKDVVNVGGQYGGGKNYSDFVIDKTNLPTEFNAHGAIVVVSVPDNKSAGVPSATSLKVDGDLAFFSSDTIDGMFPNNHAPQKNDTADFLFFDIGDFGDTEQVPNFDESDAADTGNTEDGEIKELLISGIGLLEWMHFDLMAIETTMDVDTNKKTQTVVTTWDTDLVNNPGSHDVTRKKPGGGGQGGQVPEPNVIGLFGMGLVAMGLSHIRRKRKAH